MLRRFGVSNRTATAGNFVGVFFALIGVGQLVYWTIDRAIPVTVHWRSVVYESVRPGGEFLYFNDFTRTKFCEAMVERWIVDSTRARLDIETLHTGMPTEGLDIRQVSMARIPVPKGIADGPAKSCFRSSWMCNPLQHGPIWPFSPIKGPETCLNFNIDSHALPMSFAPLRRVTLAETWP